MVKIRYNGIYDPCEIKVLGNRFKNWHCNEVRDISEKYAKILADVDGFSLVKTTDNKKPKKSQKQEPERTEEKIVSDIEVNKEDVIDLDTATKDEMLDYTVRHGIEADYWLNKDDIKKLIEDYINSHNSTEQKKEKEEI